MLLSWKSICSLKAIGRLGLRSIFFIIIIKKNSKKRKRKSVKAPLCTRIIYKGATKPAQRERDPTNPRDPKNPKDLRPYHVSLVFPTPGGYIINAIINGFSNSTPPSYL